MSKTLTVGIMASAALLWITGCTSTKMSDVASQASSSSSSSTTSPNPTPGNPPPTTLPPSGAPYSQDDYPHLGLISIGGPQTYAPSSQAFMAKVHMVIIGGTWEGWQIGRGYTKESFISGVKAQSKVNTRVFEYVNFNEMAFTRADNWNPTFFDEVSLMNWWLYNAGTSGTKTPDWQDTSKGLVNMGPAVQKDPTTGLGPYQWGAKYASDYYHLGKNSNYSPAPSLDGFFLDNVFVNPYVDGDWDLTGKAQPGTGAAAQAAVMSGEKSYFDYLHSVWPSGVQIGNSGDAIGEAVDDGYDISTLNGVLQGGVFEGAIGMSYSIETWGGALTMQRRYNSAEKSLSAPKLEIFGHSKVTATGTDPTTSTNWQASRYGITACLMNDGYYYAASPVGYDEETPANRLWFDEYDNAGAGVGYLGQPVNSSGGAPQTVAWSQGVWKREFQKGIVLWNPKGNGQKTVSLSGLGNLKRLKGTQDTTTNNGGTVTNGTITLQDRDGIILLRY